MNLLFDTSMTRNYRSSSQIARVLTESWVANNMYCPHCGRCYLQKFTNNRPVADFFCPECRNEYELKSKNGKLGQSITDGAYETMIQRITSNNNPDFFFLSYSKEKGMVNDLLFIPKHFFWPGIIEKRKPLASTARRAGWTGCKILIEQIPEQGRITIISNSIIRDKNTVLSEVRSSERLKTDEAKNRGWLFDVLNCINSLPFDSFSINDMYSFEEALAKLHPENNHIRPKIRQQLQVIRDMGLIAFVEKGYYKKISV